MVNFLQFLANSVYSLESSVTCGICCPRYRLSHGRPRERRQFGASLPHRSSRFLRLQGDSGLHERDEEAEDPR